MKKSVDEIVMNIPIFFEDVPEENLGDEIKIREELMKRNGETVMLLDKNLLDKNRTHSTYFLCRIKIDPEDAEHYTIQVPLDGSNPPRFWESKLKYDALKGLMVKTKHSGYLFSKKYRKVSE